MKYILDEIMDIEETKQLTDNNNGNIYYVEDKQEKNMDINQNVQEEDHEYIETLLKSYYEGFVDMNHPKYHTIKTTYE